MTAVYLNTEQGIKIITDAICSATNNTIQLLFVLVVVSRGLFFRILNVFRNVEYCLMELDLQILTPS